MATIDTPMNTAHQHAANADDYLAKGLIVLASEEHFKAAEAYLAGIDRSHDESAKRTLRMLYNDHCKAGKELQRKIEKLKMEGKDPALPQKLDATTSPKTNIPRSNSRPYVGPSRVNTSSPQPVMPMSDSQNAGEESFMLLGGQRSDPGDAFNQFWNIMQGMLDNISQPVAFATVPIGNPELSNTPTPDDQRNHRRQNKSSDERKRDGSVSSDTDPDEPIFSRFTRKIGISREGSRVGWSGRGEQSPGPSSSAAQRDDFGDDDDGDFLEDGDDDLSGSFCLIPTGDEPTPAVLKKENASLKNEIATLRAQLENQDRLLKRRKEQDTQLRDSIFLATREAQRALGASGILPRAAPPLEVSGLNLNVPPVAIPPIAIPGLSTTREAQYAKRIKELEDELRLMRVENEKNKMMIVKFRERWEKLKDSAKRKKEAKAAAETAANGVRDRIVEEPEAEEELDTR
ncbi:hypothetical protein CVT24_003065 [Panaeolus cyanescens]|uniref:MIT domain-containing protein n=1 Tax=Panaeolus cyanescens TaxID=181874 RepID=A0A409VFS1_9AGAR|nr:hypothetical protein CVT24_003065 [Panaeolus cyanescens]